MDYRESEGRTVEEALRKIYTETNWTEEDIEFEIIEQRKKILGFFGKETVQIKAWKKNNGEKYKAVLK